MLKKIAGKIWRIMPVWGRRTAIRLTQPSFTVSAGVVVHNDAGQVLLLNHVLRPASGWGIPGGFLNAGEQPEEAAKREVFEETGLQIEDVKMLDVRTIRQHVEFWFYARANGTAAAKSREILEARWFALAEMPAEMGAKDRRLIERAFDAGEKLSN